MKHKDISKVTGQAKPMTYPVDIFPSRMPGERITVELLPDGGVSGIQGGFSIKERKAYIQPDGSTYQREVRHHEALHGLYSDPATFDPSMVGQAIEDCRIHRNFSKQTGQQRRDEVFVAYTDLHSILHAKSPDPDGCLLMLIRSLGILNGGPSPKSAGKLVQRVLESRALSHARRAASAQGCSVEARLNDMLSAVVREDLPAAKAAVRDLFKHPTATPTMQQQFQPAKLKDGGKGQSDGKGQGKTDKDDKGKDGSFESVKEQEPKPIEPEKVAAEKAPETTPNTDLIKPDLMSGVIGADRAGWHPSMVIRKLHQTTSKKTTQGQGERLHTSGLRVVGRKLAIAASSPVPIPCFERRKHEKGGCLLIDASGSMSITDAMLRECIKAAPVGTVAYYSGDDSYVKTADGNYHQQAHGDLVIYADKGLMYDCDANPWLSPEDQKRGYKEFEGHTYGGTLPFRIGGNSIDFPAMLWLSKQPAPRYCVTDWGFCGADPEYSAAAKNLLENMVTRGMVKVFRSLSEYMQHIGVPEDVIKAACSMD